MVSPPGFPMGENEHPQWELVNRIEFGPPLGADRAIFADIGTGPSGCNSKALQLHLNSFEPAKSEVPAIQKPTRKTVEGNRETPRQ